MNTLSTACLRMRGGARSAVFPENGWDWKGQGKNVPTIDLYWRVRKKYTQRTADSRNPLGLRGGAWWPGPSGWDTQFARSRSPPVQGWPFEYTVSKGGSVRVYIPVARSELDSTQKSLSGCPVPCISTPCYAVAHTPYGNAFEAKPDAQPAICVGYRTARRAAIQNAHPDSPNPRRLRPPLVTTADVTQDLRGAADGTSRVRGSAMAWVASGYRVIWPFALPFAKALCFTPTVGGLGRVRAHAKTYGMMHTSTPSHCELAQDYAAARASLSRVRGPFRTVSYSFSGDLHPLIRPGLTHSRCSVDDVLASLRTVFPSK
ncbi:hypothetical protein DFH06DRAFT_1399601 [Mycena polygramma]|nr:hypothetical protein DFH06DRAFT_1399601 [Mycena polygramma]